MASSSGNSNSSSSAATTLPCSGSEGDTQHAADHVTDVRKRKRMESNRESARRSRMRKQKHLDDVTAQILQLTKENSQILCGINSATQHLLNVEAENSVLRAQVAELSQRLQSLDEILNFICSINLNGGCVDDGDSLIFDGPLTNHVDMGYVQMRPPRMCFGVDDDDALLVLGGCPGRTY